MPGPLEGIRVIELAVLHVGPPIGYILGDLGAEVIKVERPDGGDGFRTLGPFWFEAVNRNKKSVALNLKQSQGRDILSRLICSARVSLSVGLVGMLTATVIGVSYGSILGYYVGKLDNL